MQCDENPTNALAILNFLAHADITAKDLWSSQIADALPPFCQVCHCLDLLVLDHANWVCQTSSGCRQDPLDSQSWHGIVRQSLLASSRMLQMLDKVCIYGIFSMSSISDMAMPHDNQAGIHQQPAGHQPLLAKQGRPHCPHLSSHQPSHQRVVDKHSSLKR